MLILIEGIPGSGKSTLAQSIAHQLGIQGILVRWWYEEEKGHPVYVFHDGLSLRRVVDDLCSGNDRQVIAEALVCWRRFATLVAASDAVVILDGCLFGYLTWSLFPLETPEQDILAYLASVERILASLDPRLVYLFPSDIRRAMERVCNRRGDWSEQFIRKSTDNAYARRRALLGFAGAVDYWGAYQSFTVTAFAQWAFPKLAVDIEAGDWPVYGRQVLRFLELPSLAEDVSPPAVLRRFTGMYMSGDGKTCTVRLERQQLLIDGLPFVWPRTPLVPRSLLAFAIQSLPIDVTFVEGSTGTIDRLLVTGPELLEGKVDAVFVKNDG